MSHNLGVTSGKTLGNEDVIGLCPACWLMGIGI